MLKYPPMQPTSLTPIDIIGRHNLPLFEKHFSIASSSTNAGEWPEKRLNKEIGPADRKIIGETLQELRENGFYPLELDNTGHIRWGVVTKKLDQLEMEKGLPELVRLPEKQLQDMARRGYLKAIEHVKIKPVSETEMIYEGVV